MPITSIGAGLLAGILSTLSPCVFPLLPLVIGAATTTQRSGAYWLAGGVATSFTITGLFVATIGFAIGLDGDLFRTASAVLLVLLGLALISSSIQARLGVAAGGLAGAGDRIIRRLALTSAAGQFVVGAMLGLVWSPRLRDMVATCGVGLERHGLIQIGMRMCVLSQPSPTHQSPIHATTPRAQEFRLEVSKLLIQPHSGILPGCLANRTAAPGGLTPCPGIVF